MNIAICDDQPIFIEQIYQMIKIYCAKYDIAFDLIQLYNDGESLLRDYQNGSRFDILFLDIEMPKVSGMETAEQIRLLDSDVLITFVTSHSSYMPDAFKVEAFDFISKPVTESNIFAVLTRCIQKYRQKHCNIKVRTAKGIACVKVNDIVYISSDLHYVNYFLFTGGCLRSKIKLEDVEFSLKNDSQFVRCHQSYIINLDYVQEIQRACVILRNQRENSLHSVAISRKYSNVVKEKFLLHRLKLGE